MVLETGDPSRMEPASALHLVKAVLGHGVVRQDKCVTSSLSCSSYKATKAIMDNPHLTLMTSQRPSLQTISTHVLITFLITVVKFPVGATLGRRIIGLVIRDDSCSS